MAKPSVEYIYGINPCFEVIRGGKRKIKEAYINIGGERNPRLKKLVQFLNSRDISLEFVPKDRLFQLSKSKDHQGAVIKTTPYPYNSLNDIIGKNKILLLDNVEDPHNVGAILRSAEIFGFHHVLLPLRGVPDVYPSVVKVSAGGSEHITIVKETSSNNYVKRLQDEGYTVIALDEEGNTSLSDIKNQKIDKTLLVIGGEGKSVGQFIINNADFVTKIDQVGKINSLNASVAASIAMYELGDKNET